ncbi:pitrilysin family protein [Undibacterium sp.]|jgi:zinc protease|uniref:M16 family metallopeptidase n=1 Tax=Undibacterium sp. TaxID=1914977 RepID=UPI002BCFCEB0|nr:pitrilysin family protein [Undibacterium sp.]HTD02823.1 pitrilysin family protein [Undibacterium sp.]
MKRFFAIAVAALANMGSPAFAGDFRLPAFETGKLSNGITVYLMERHDVPLIAVRAVLKAGAVSDRQQAGLANLTGDGLLLGSAKFDKKTVDQTFDFLGARISSVTGTEQSGLVADFARDDAPRLLPIFADILQHPVFDAEEFNKLRARTIDELRQAKESPRNVVQTYYRSMLFGSGAYANPVSGTMSSVAALQRSDLQAFHRAYYRPDNAALIVVGDFKPAAMRQQLESLFGQWRAGGEMPKPAANGKVQADKARVWLVNKSDAVETTFLFGGAGIARNDPDYVPLQVLNTILGGRFTSWLNDELRVNSGLTYGARSEFSTLSQTGTFAVSSFTATPKTEAALALAASTYQRLWDKGIDAATLESAKAYVKGQYPPRFETSQQLAGLLADMYVNQVGREQIDNFTRDVDSLTPERARQLVDKHFPRDKLQMVLIGKADAIRGIAGKYGDMTELDITASGFAPASPK